MEVSAKVTFCSKFNRFGYVKCGLGKQMAASEAKEATEVKNSLKNGLSDLKYLRKDTHIVLIFKFHIVASEVIWQPQEP